MVARRLELSRTLGPHVVSWIESSLVHGPGDVQGERIVLDDEQVRFVFRCYEIDARGKRVIRRAVFSRAKGRAKSELSAMLACAEGLGPVRFAGWGDDGMPLARPVSSPLIRCAATEEGQTDNCYAAVEFMLREGPVSATPGLDVGITRTFLPGGGKIVPITAKASSKDGGLETFAVFDETHLYVLLELHRLHSTIRRNLGKRKDAQPWSLETSTMYAPGEESVAEHSHRYAEAIAAGVVSDPSFLFDHREAPRDFDFDDDDLLRAALAEAYGDAAEWMDLDRLVAEARDPQTNRDDFFRYFLNQATARNEAWIDPTLWADLPVAAAPVAKTTRITIGFDGSDTQDATALVGCTVPRDGVPPSLFVIGCWERPEKAAKDWKVPRKEVKAKVREAFAHWTVLELACDPAGWWSEIDEWLDEFGEDRVTVFRTHRPSVFAPACDRFETAVKESAVRHDGDERLARHIAAAVTRKSTQGTVIEKPERGMKRRRKVDLAVAAVIALDRSTACEDSSPYNERGLTILNVAVDDDEDVSERDLIRERLPKGSVRV